MRVVVTVSRGWVVVVTRSCGWLVVTIVSRGCVEVVTVVRGWVTVVVVSRCWVRVVTISRGWLTVVVTVTLSPFEKQVCLDQWNSGASEIPASPRAERLMGLPHTETRSDALRCSMTQSEWARVLRPRAIV